MYNGRITVRNGNDNEPNGIVRHGEKQEELNRELRAKYEGKDLTNFDERRRSVGPGTGTSTGTSTGTGTGTTLAVETADV